MNILLARICLFVVFALQTGSILATENAQLLVNDVTQLNPVKVSRIIRPENEQEIINAIKSTSGPISIAGGRYSQGGQTAYPDSLHIDMTSFNKILHFNPDKKEIRVQAGIRWRKIQEFIDPYNLSVKIMQSFANFTVGGSLSVNAHGRYVGKGAIIHSVKEIKLILADGSIRVANREQNTELFYAAIGGYGGIGVISEAVIELDDNKKIIRKDLIIPTNEYRNYFLEQIKNDPSAVFSNADLYPPYFNSLRSITWHRTEKPLTNHNRLTKIKEKYFLQPLVIDWIANHSSGSKWRKRIIDPLIYAKSPVVWQNHEASLDLNKLEPKSRSEHTYGLREYFIPIDGFEQFIDSLREIQNQYNVKVLNVSVRHSPPDTETYLSWSPVEVFSFVIYYQQGTSKQDGDLIGNWTRALNDEAIKLNGSFYLPYQPHETEDQFENAYKNHQLYFSVKQSADPNYRFRNLLLEKHYKF